MDGLVGECLNISMYVRMHARDLMKWVNGWVHVLMNNGLWTGECKLV